MLSNSNNAELFGYRPGLRLVSELLDVKHISIPASFEDIKSRVKLNICRFSNHYVTILAVITLYIILTNWELLIDITFVCIGVLIIRKLEGGSITIAQQQFTAPQLYTLLYVMILRSALLGALILITGIAGLVVLSHASLIDSPSKED